MSKVMNELLWFFMTSLSDWFKVLARFFQPIRSETKTTSGLHMHIFPRFVSATCNRPFPSSSLPPLQSESKCEVFLMKISFHSYGN